MDRLTAHIAFIAGQIVGYGAIALVLFSIAFVLAKVLKKTWPYKVALGLTIIFYATLIIGLNYLKQGT